MVRIHCATAAGSSVSQLANQAARAVKRNKQIHSQGAVTSTDHRFTSRIKPPEINIETLASTCGVAKPPGDAKYLGNQTG